MEKRYDVTLSFAGEDREYVDKVANFLKENGVSVFYDKFEEADLWGKDLGIHFDTIYRKSARYCIPFISENYKKKIWTNYEIRNAISRAIEQNEEYILPVRFDDTEIEGIRPTLGFLDLRTKSPEELTNIILKKLNSEKTIPVAQIFQEQISDVVHVAIYNSFYMGGPKVVNGGVSLSIRVTNKLKGDYRYFYQPSFRITIPLKGADAFQLVQIDNKYSFPVKMEFGQEITFNFPLSEGQIKFFEDLEHNCEFYAVCSTTIGEVFESNKLTVKSLIQAFNL